MDFDTYLRLQNTTLEEMQEELKPIAEERIQRGLVMAEIARLEDITVDEDQIETDVTRAFNQMTANMTNRDKKRLIARGALSTLVSNAVSDAILEKAMDHIRALATGELDAPAE